MATNRKHRNPIERPKKRSDCKNGPRPCPWVSCRYNLYLDVNSETGSIKVNFPDQEPWECKHSCALDVAEEGELTFEEIGGVMNLTRERIRQIMAEVLQHMYSQICPDQPRAAMLPVIEQWPEAE
jgi:hypothetical protein